MNSELKKQIEDELANTQNGAHSCALLSIGNKFVTASSEIIVITLTNGPFVHYKIGQREKIDFVSKFLKLLLDERVDPR